MIARSSLKTQETPFSLLGAQVRQSELHKPLLFGNCCGINDAASAVSNRLNRFELPHGHERDGQFSG